MSIRKEPRFGVERAVHKADGKKDTPILRDREPSPSLVLIDASFLTRSLHEAPDGGRYFADTSGLTRLTDHLARLLEGRGALTVALRSGSHIV